MYVHVCVCIYFIKWCERVFNFRYGIFVLSFFPPFRLFVFSFVILRGTVFRGTPCQRVPRDTIRVYTLAHAMLFMCIRDRLFRTTVAGGGGTKGK